MGFITKALSTLRRTPAEASKLITQFFLVQRKWRWWTRRIDACSTWRSENMSVIAAYSCVSSSSSAVLFSTSRLSNERGCRLTPAPPDERATSTCHSLARYALCCGYRYLLVTRADMAISTTDESSWVFRLTRSLQAGSPFCFSLEILTTWALMSLPSALQNLTISSTLKVHTIRLSSWSVHWTTWPILDGDGCCSEPCTYTGMLACANTPSIRWGLPHISIWTSNPLSLMMLPRYRFRPEASWWSSW